MRIPQSRRSRPLFVTLDVLMCSSTTLVIACWGHSRRRQWNKFVDTILRPCSAKSVMKQVHHRSVHGTIVGSDCKTICKCNGCSATQTTYCNKIEVSGNATGYEDGLTNIASATKPTVCDACTIPMPTVPNPSINNVTIVFPPLFPMPLAPVPDPISGNPPLIPMPMAPMPELFPGNPQLPPVTGNP